MFWDALKQRTEKVRALRAKIFECAKHAPDLETMHWWMWLDECFENDTVQSDKIATAKWRATVLHWKKQISNEMLWEIDVVLKETG